MKARPKFPVLTQTLQALPFEIGNGTKLWLLSKPSSNLLPKVIRFKKNIRVCLSLVCEVTPPHVVRPTPACESPAICPWFALVHYKERTLSLLIQSSSVLSPKKLSFCQLVFVFRVQVLIRFNLFQENNSTNDLHGKFLCCSLGYHSCSIDLLWKGSYI